MTDYACRRGWSPNLEGNGGVLHADVLEVAPSHPPASGRGLAAGREVLEEPEGVISHQPPLEVLGVEEQELGGAGRVGLLVDWMVCWEGDFTEYIPMSVSASF